MNEDTIPGIPATTIGLGCALLVAIVIAIAAWKSSR